MLFAWLFFQTAEVNAALVYANRCACFHPCSTDAMLRDTIGEIGYCRLGYASSRYLLATYVQQSVEESACSHYYAASFDLCSPDGANADDFVFFCQQLTHLVLPDVEVVSIVECPSPLPDEFSSIALGPWTPYGRAFAHIQHAELNARGISHQSHLSAQGIYFSHDLSLGYSANGRIARHLCNLVHVHRHEECLGAHIGRGTSRLAPCMSASYYYYFVP